MVRTSVTSLFSPRFDVFCALSEYRGTAKWNQLFVKYFDYSTGYIFELIFKKVATEIEHILRLSKLKEYASH